jgi:tRNA G18 (ribose-2'-O)-methylase SpoU
MPRIIRPVTVDDPRVRDYALVADPELVCRRGLFVAEGRLVVERLVAARRYTIQSMLLSDAAMAALAAVVERLDESVPVYVCAVQEMLRLTGLNIHRGCLALVERPETRSVDSVLAAARTLVVLEGVANPDNVGGIFRNAAAFGADAVILSPTCCDPLYRKAIRTSMGATLSVPYARAAAWPADLRQLREAGFVVAALTPRAPSQAIGEFVRRARPQRIALLFGTEGAGLTVGACELADLRVRIPVVDAIDSLNVAVASAIVLSRLAEPAE